MNSSRPVPGELLPWDTEFFGFRIARAGGDTLNAELAAEIDAWCGSNRIRCLYFLARADDPATSLAAGQNGFGLVDIRMSFELKPAESVSPVEMGAEDISLRPFQAADLPALQALARASHRETRFFSDPNFSRSRAEELYATWIRRECEGHEGQTQRVLVAAAQDGQPLGYISCHLDASRQQGEIGLVGVSAEARGQGIGKSLVLAAIEWFRTQGAQKVTVVTQGNNLVAQRLYQRCGFLSRDVRLWYHKWYPA